ncbi:hypothetical protein V5R04_09420 [Jonesiaceae bacterium BS-20]|uniref:Lipoprotein n=1 Tax=Jonesiaceae bacterium BS-20 TaxID=3120821 RepID=A0AAU7DTQ5_9MICO
MRLPPRFALVPIVALAILLISGCLATPSPTGKNPNFPHDAPAGGQTFAQMEESIAMLPGIVTAEISGYEQLNLQGNTGVGIDLELDPGYQIVDGPALLTFLIESAWSVREGYMPNTSISVSFSTDGDFDVDANVYAYEAGWDDELQPTERSEWNFGFSRANVWLRNIGQDTQGQKNLLRLGQWPGPVPEVPQGAIIPRK